MTGNLTYQPAGATRPSDLRWTPDVAGFRGYERTVRVGSARDWDRLTDQLLAWGVKTRSGFDVRPLTGDDSRVRLGQDYLLTAAFGPIAIIEPVRVVAFVEESDVCGFAYGTLEGHPVCGEEAFILRRTPDGNVWLTLRSLTRPAAGRWRLAFPVILVAQRGYRWRYRRALFSS